MSQHIQQTITALEQEIEAIDQHRGSLVRAIDVLRPLAAIGTGALAPMETRALRNDRQTDRQSKARAIPAPRSLPEDAGRGEAILAQLRKHGGVMKPGDLAGALKCTPPRLRLWMKPLIKAKAVIATGTTMSRRFSLPGKAPAKEAPQRR